MSGNEYRRNNKGITIIEVIVVVALIGIVSVPLIHIMGTNNKIVSNSQQMMEANNIALIAEQYIKDQLLLANQVRIVTLENPTQEDIDALIQGMETEGYVVNQICKKGREIIHNDKAVISETLLGQLEIEIKFKKVSSDIIGVRIMVKDQQNTVIKELVTDIKIQNLLEDKQIQGILEQNGVIFITY